MAHQKLWGDQCLLHDPTDHEVDLVNRETRFISSQGSQHSRRNLSQNNDQNTARPVDSKWTYLLFKQTVSSVYVPCSGNLTIA
ncbi:hypothetical protein RDI58_024757 [Solanum bulbocastanum]|uniref:Uncharacterized protein n=1 Tax=Solanum bulbocastanum TaxID=147425 RepID=A0AAN8T1U8_SOLBU